MLPQPPDPRTLIDSAIRIDDDLILEFPPDENLLYCNNNPDPDTICDICAPDIGRVFAPGTEPHLPRHDNCYCYYIPTPRQPTPPRLPPQPIPY